MNIKCESYQCTINEKVSVSGIGLHSGKKVNLTIKPGKENSGISFCRLDSKGMSIPARMDRVIDTHLATTIAENNVMVSTTEHLLASFAGLGIDNAVVDLDGAEVPIMDGSAAPFVNLLKKVGLRRQQAPKRILKIVDEVSFFDGQGFIRILPHKGLRITCEIEFNHRMINHQIYSIDLSPERFTSEISQARTFGFLEQVEKLQRDGRALGGSLENAVVLDRFSVLNQEGLRFADEFVRHKILDVIGDMALLGCPLLGHVIAYKSGHQHHLRLMQEIVRHPECWELVELNNHAISAFPFLAAPSVCFATEPCPV